MTATSVELLHVVSLRHKGVRRFATVVELVKPGARPKLQRFARGTFPEASAVVRIDNRDNTSEYEWVSTRDLKLTYMAHAVPR